MRKSLHNFCLGICLVTLALYLLTLATVSYVGVYLTYVAIPVIIVSGLFAYWLEPKKREEELGVEKSPLQRLREIEKRLEELDS